MFVIAVKNDPRVPVTESEQIVAALEQKTPVWYRRRKTKATASGKNRIWTSSSIPQRYSWKTIS